MPKNMPMATSFKQQKLRACTPILTPFPVITTFFIIGIIFIPIGAILLTQSNDVVEVSVRYDNQCNETCKIQVQIPTKMTAPVYFYYGLSNFYQNHRQYVKSRSDKQLHGDSIGSVSDASTCDPITSVNGSSNRSALFVPCGLIARSTFNDSFTLNDPNGGQIQWTNDGIAWQSDINGLYGGHPDTRGTLMDPPVPGCTDLNNCTFQDPDFIVWMRVAALPTFRKLHRIISTDLAPGTYTVTIVNNFPVYQFSGQKRFIISTSSWIGGKNSFLGISYLVVGSFSLVVALLFFILHKLRPRKFGDISLIEWMDSEGPNELHN